MPSPAPTRTLLTRAELQARAGVVCIALSGEGMAQQARTEADRNAAAFLEFRLDSVPAPEAVLGGLRDLLAAHPQITAIATCRRTAFGGGYDGTAQQQVDLLTEAAHAGCVLADLEVETAEELGQPALQQLRDAGAAVILSWHDFSRTPELDPVLERMRRFSPEFYKVVPTAQSLRDGLQVVRLLQHASQNEPLIAMAMGMCGVFTRVLGPRFGSVFTFASPDTGQGTAPGQVNAAVLRDLYRIGSITPRTQIYAVAGSPIGGSLSPLMHNTAFRSAGIDAVYLPLETADAAELREVMEALDLRGLSVTMPLKETVLPLLLRRDETVEQMGACNTLLRHADGNLAGFNTDVEGIVGPLQREEPLRGKRVLILGAGGAARAAVFGLRDRGAEVFLLNRTAARAEALATEAGVQLQTRAGLAQQTFDIIINSTPYGMRGRQMEPPITSTEMNCSLFFDLVYNPVETPLMRMAARRNIATLPGVAMFVAQGVRQFSLWTGQEAPAGDMLRIVMDALNAPAG